MKNSRTWKILMYAVLYPIIIVVLAVLSCMFFNFLLVPKNTTIVETIVADAKQSEENIDVLFLGSSRTYRGIDSVDLSADIGKKVFNVAYENANYFGLYHLLLELSQTNNLEMVFLEVSISDFSRDESTEDRYIYRALSGKNKKAFAKGLGMKYNNFPLFEFTNYMDNFSNGRFVDCVSDKFGNFKNIGDAVSNSRTKYMGNGFLFAKSKANGKELILPRSYGDGQSLWKNEFATSTQVEYFNKIIDFCQERNIEVELYSPAYPASVTTKEMEAFDMFDQYVKDLTAERNLNFLDFSLLKKEHIQWQNDWFYNANHMNGYGAQKLEKVLANIVLDIFGDTFDQEQYFVSCFEDLTVEEV